MKTRREQMTSGGLDGYSNFAGDDSDYRDWFGIVGRSRDSSELEESNFHAALQMLGGESDTVRVERYGHWAVGWIEEVYVKPGSPAETIARSIEAQMEDYPVLDEEDFCQREHKSAQQVWSDCYSDSERVQYMRENASQFEPNSFADLLGCARGKYFIGYASELIN